MGVPDTMTETDKACVEVMLDKEGVTVTVGAVVVVVDAGTPMITVCHPSGFGVMVNVF